MRTPIAKKIRFSIVVIFALLGLVACGDGPHMDFPEKPSQGFGGKDSDLPNQPMVTFAKDIQPILAVRCNMCHMAGGALPNWADYNTSFSRRDVIRNRVVVVKTMPPSNSTQMTEEEREIMKFWIDSGAPR